jgi:hypothetical protein
MFCHKIQMEDKDAVCEEGELICLKVSSLFFLDFLTNSKELGPS